MTSFLDALRAKDPDLLYEATALHAATEARTRNQKLFASILNKELSQEDLDELAQKLDGFTIAGQNDPKSTGKLGIILQKTEGRNLYSRTLTVRKEKAGWKVQDIGGEADYSRSTSGVSSKRAGGR